MASWCSGLVSAREPEPGVRSGMRGLGERIGSGLSFGEGGSCTRVSQRNLV